VSSNFNGLTELLNRPDAGSELLMTYQTMNPLAMNAHWTDVQKGQFSFSFAYIEIFTSTGPNPDQYD